MIASFQVGPGGHERIIVHAERTERRHDLGGAGQAGIIKGFGQRQHPVADPAIDGGAELDHQRAVRGLQDSEIIHRQAHSGILILSY